MRIACFVMVLICSSATWASFFKWEANSPQKTHQEIKTWPHSIELTLWTCILEKPESVDVPGKKGAIAEFATIICRSKKDETIWIRDGGSCLYDPKLDLQSQKEFAERHTSFALSKDVTQTELISLDCSKK